MALDRASDDLDRLFRHLVYTLADRRPGRLHAPFQVSDLYQEILPYRAFRSQLRFDSNEDYEMAVLRLLAGVKGYATLEPPEAQEALALEAQAVSPFTGAFRDYAAARVTLAPAAARAVLAQRASYAPTTALAEDVPLKAPPPAPGTTTDQGSPSSTLPYMLDAMPDAPGACPHCARALPSRRTVLYCPFCGETVSAPRCPKCDTELEPGWTFCITCRHPL